LSNEIDTSYTIKVHLRKKLIKQKTLQTDATEPIQNIGHQ
jgi:hypothetical protein